QGSTLVDLVNLIGLALGREPLVTYEPARAGEVTRYVADISKARQLLGYNPQTPLSAGVPRAIRWEKEAGDLGLRRTISDCGSQLSPETLRRALAGALRLDLPIARLPVRHERIQQLPGDRRNLVNGTLKRGLIDL